jgi:hypothetical protein
MTELSLALHKVAIGQSWAAAGSQNRRFTVRNPSRDMDFECETGDWGPAGIRLQN